MSHSTTMTVLLVAMSCLNGCATETGTGATGGSGGNGSGGAGGANATPTTATFEIAAYPDGAGLFALVPISVNGSPIFGVLLDTGSDGLRVFADALQGTQVDVSSTAVDVEFGYGNSMAGHLATGEVSFGGVETAGPVAFHLIESFECAPSYPGCDFAGGEAAILTDAGIHGILGVSTRAGLPEEIYSPFAQLGEPRSNGFVVRTGGFDSASGEIAFGLAAADVAGFAEVSLVAMGSQVNGVPAWRDDAVQTCFTVAGTSVDPPCTDTVFDTGASVDVIYAPNLPIEQVLDGALAPGVSFEARVDPALDLAFTVGAVPEPSVDLVFVDDAVPFALLGMGVFFRNDVLFDLAHGTIGFRPL